MTKRNLIADRRDLILKELLEGTGAEFAAAEVDGGLRRGLRVWFAELDERHGPVAELRPYGLKGHQINLFFGNFSGDVIAQILKAAPEDVQLARALVSSIRTDVAIEIPGQSFEQWSVSDGSFRIRATIRDQEQPHDDAALVSTCHEVIVPLMAAMAELIGYDVIEDRDNADAAAYEGAVLKTVVRRRERNPRNRLLCLRIHGEKCIACGLEPRRKYREAGAIIEVHHLEPLSNLLEPRPYDPRTDLVPLCPACHRAVHTRKPIPYSLEELAEIMGSCDV